MTVTTAVGSRFFVGPVRPSIDYASVVTMTIAAPGVVTWAAHGLPSGMPIKLTTTGALPTGLVPGTTYYVKTVTTNTFELAATQGGSSITTSGTQSGVHTATRGPVDSAEEYSVLTWTEVGETSTLGEFGDQKDIVMFRALADARQRKLAGIADAGEVPVVVGRDPFNIGQQTLRAAARTKFEYAFKIQAADNLDANDTPSVFYFGAIVGSAREAPGDGSEAWTTTFNLAVNTDVVEVSSVVIP